MRGLDGGSCAAPRRGARPGAGDRRADDHQRGQPADLGQHLRRRVRRRGRRDRPGGAGGAARARRIGRRDVSLGFSYAYRYIPDQDVASGAHRRAATPRLPRARSTTSACRCIRGCSTRRRLTTRRGRAALDGLTLVRDCYMPLAGARGRQEIWITENGYATNLGHTRAAPGRRARGHGRRIHLYSATARDQRLPLLQPARQPARRDRPVRRRRPAARRLHAEARFRRLPAADPALRHALSASECGVRRRSVLCRGPVNFVSLRRYTAA